MVTLYKQQNDESDDQYNSRIKKSKVSNLATRSEKTGWLRKRKNLAEYVVDNINPIEEQIIEIRTQILQPMYDHIHELRKDLVSDCIHPFEELRELDDGTIECTFCNKKFNLTED